MSVNSVDNTDRMNSSNIPETVNFEIIPVEPSCQTALSIDNSSIIWSEGSYPETFSSTSKNLSEEPVKNIESETKYDEQTKNKRTKIIFMSVIAVLILVIIIMAVTLATLLRSTNTEIITETTTTQHINFQFDTTVIINTPITYEVGTGGASGDPPCSSYTVVNDPLRNVNTPGIGGTCDNGPLFNTSIGGRWIRFVGAGGSMMAQTSPEINHCGAFIPAWYNGSLPSITGTIVNGSICIQTSIGVNCKVTTDASVVNCGVFYVYFLSPLILCNGRYCTT